MVLKYVAGMKVPFGLYFYVITSKEQHLVFYSLADLFYRFSF